MQQRQLGASGLLVSALTIGTTNFGRSLDQKGADDVVAAAIDTGVTMFDTAEIYNDGRSEEMLGQALGPKRSHVVVATKWGQQKPPPPGEAAKPFRGASRREIVRAVEANLKRLKTDYIDLYQLHQPDLETPVEETLRALGDLIAQGKVRYIGVSNVPAWRVVEYQLAARQAGLSPFVSCQDEYSLLVRDGVEPDLANVMSAHGLGLLPYTALASGMLTGKYKRGMAFPPGSRFADAPPSSVRFAGDRKRFTQDRAWDVVEALEAFAGDRGHSLLELALSWLLARPFVASVITGAMSKEQVAQNADAARWRLDASELAAIDAICAGERN
jgi:aryl-alcohol dehydrogenase-like predicted oxidoreductase